MHTFHLVLLVASLLLNIWQWHAAPTASQPGSGAAGSPLTVQCDSPNTQSEPAQEETPPNPKLDAAISQSSEGSVLIDRLYAAEQGNQLTTVFEQLDIEKAVHAQVQEQLRELYRLSFDHPDAYEQESRRIWNNLSNLLGDETRTRLEQEIYSGNTYLLLEIQGRLAERGELLAPPQRQSLTRLLSEATQHLAQQESGDASTYLENQRAYTRRVLENSRSVLNPYQFKVLQDILARDLVRQEVSIQMDTIYQHFQPDS